MPSLAPPSPPAAHPASPLPAHDGLIVDSLDTVWSGRFPLQRVSFRNRRFDGTWSQPRIWEMWRRGAAAAVIPYDPESDRVVTVEQFRLPALAAGMDPIMVEFVAGLADAGEAPDVTARREAREEMGLDVRCLHRIGDFILTPGGADEHCTLFAGRVSIPPCGEDGVLGYGGLRSEQEDIRVRAIPLAAAIDAALAGRYPNALTTIALLWLAAKRDWLRQAWVPGD